MSNNTYTLGDRNLLLRVLRSIRNACTPFLKPPSEPKEGDKGNDEEENQEFLLSRGSWAPTDYLTRKSFFARKEDFKAESNEAKTSNERIKVGRKLHFISTLEQEYGARYASRRHALCRLTNEAERMFHDLPRVFSQD